jgi:DNA-binding NarL/FixJ family response regulator
MLRVAGGMTNEGIARELSISVTTVRDHLAKVYVKLNIDSREELIKKLTG